MVGAAMLQVRQYSHAVEKVGLHAPAALFSMRVTNVPNLLHGH